MAIKPVEKIVFGRFDSATLGLYLVDRSAPTPAEKRIVEDVPYANGEYDFSELLGQRVYANRKLTYHFWKQGVEYSERKRLEGKVKALLMDAGTHRLDDTHDRDVWWRGKCESVAFDESETTMKKREANITAVFNVYPLAIKPAVDAADQFFPPFHFPKDVWQRLRWTIYGSKQVTIVNSGCGAVCPYIECDTATTIIDSHGVNYAFVAGKHQHLGFWLQVGENQLNIQSNGKVRIWLDMEVMR